ncbi:MAG TPA: glycosyltransferase family 1 protein [Flavobacterium sp.]|jgi:glycosyltransferase involved in cell wall biosynthesis
MRTVILETHNLKNLTGGFGVFNYGLVKAFSKMDLGNLSMKLCIQKSPAIQAEFKKTFGYITVFGFNRYKWLRINAKYDLWHSVNQNTKIEPRRIGKYLLTIHDVNFTGAAASNKSNKRYQSFHEKLQRADAITYISEFAKRQTHECFDVPNVPEYVIHNGNPITELLDTTSYKSAVPVDKPYFYTIGDFLHKKNFTAIVEMMAELPDYNLILSGNNNKPYGEEVKNLITRLHLENRVFLTGKVDNVGKQYYMKNCAAFLFPSTGEGFGLPPIEAMKFGKPIFLANRTSLPEVGGDHSFYWDDFDPKYMADTVLNGLNKYNSNKDFYIRYYKERAESFSWDVAASKYVEVYNTLLS